MKFCGFILLITISLLTSSATLRAEDSGNEWLHITGYNNDIKNHQMQIFFSDGTNKIIPKEKGQASVSNVVIYPGETEIGWLVGYENCCTSYDLPRTLVVYLVDGTKRAFEPTNPMITSWYFRDEGRKALLVSSYPHGTDAADYDLYDQRVDSPLPKWAQGLTEVTGQ
jgi:hypothetical protein